MKNFIRFSNVLVLAVLFMAVTIVSVSSRADVWPTENEWSPAWEQKYKDWLRNSTDAKFFSRKINADGNPNPYYGIRVDCADLVYSLRIIFSFENHLPFGLHNAVSGANEIITNGITRYDKLPEGYPRARAFLEWIYGIVSTHTMAADTYSIPFSAVGEGSIILTTKKNHHSWTIRDVTSAGNPGLIFNSTVGRLSGYDVQVRESWPNPSWVFEPEVSANDPTKNIPVYRPGSYAGFRFWRPVAFLTKPEVAVPGYSDEQFTVGLNQWKTKAVSHLASVTETVDQIVMRLLKDACADFQQRVTAVAEAEQFKRRNPGQCLNSTDFDEYSTPSRDRRMIDGIVQARVYFQDGLKQSGEGAFSVANLVIYKTMFPFISNTAAEEARLDVTAKSPDNFCSLKVNDQLGRLSLAELKRRAFAGRMSANPNDSSTGRFGYVKTSSDIAYTTCSSNNFGLNPSVYNLDQLERDARKEISGR